MYVYVCVCMYMIITVMQVLIHLYAIHRKP
jgi:hypothetical protein